MQALIHAAFAGADHAPLYCDPSGPVVAIVGAALIRPSLIPAEELRTRAQTAASDALGREVVLDGDIRLQILPTVQVRASNARIANAPALVTSPSPRWRRCASRWPCCR
jgi:hypothetical protein